MKGIVGLLLAATLIVQGSIGVTAASPRQEQSTQAAGSLRDAARREGARLATMSHPKSASQAAPQTRNWVARHPVLVGTLAGAGVGLGFAAGSGCESSSDYTCGGIAMFFAGTGAALGAVGGLVASAFIR